MKNNSLLYGFLAIFSFFIMAAAAPLVPSSISVKYPKKVDTIIQSKCYGCHSPESKGDKSRKALNWEELGDLETDSQLKKFQAISNVLEKGVMPPQKMVARNPELKLTEKETKKFQKWAAKMERKASK